MEQALRDSTPISLDVIEHILSPMVYELNHREKFAKVLELIPKRWCYELNSFQIGLDTWVFHVTHSTKRQIRQIRIHTTRPWHQFPYAQHQNLIDYWIPKPPTIKKIMSKLRRKPGNTFKKDFPFSNQKKRPTQ